MNYKDMIQLNQIYSTLMPPLCPRTSWLYVLMQLYERTQPIMIFTQMANIGCSGNKAP